MNLYVVDNSLNWSLVSYFLVLEFTLSFKENGCHKTLYLKSLGTLHWDFVHRHKIKSIESQELINQIYKGLCLVNKCKN